MRKNENGNHLLKVDSPDKTKLNDPTYRVIANGASKMPNEEAFIITNFTMTFQL